MTTGFLTLKVDGGEVSEAIAVAISAVDDLSPLFEAVHPAYLANARRMFGSAGFGRWPGVEADGLQYQTVKGKILGWQMSSADLLRWDRFGGRERIYPSMTQATHPENVAEIEPRRATFGTSVPYAVNHETGSGVGPKWGGSKSIPKRELTLTDREFTMDIQQAASDYAGLVAETVGRTTVGLTSSEVLLEVTGRRGFPTRD
jgi:hypothetical protein